MTIRWGVIGAGGIARRRTIPEGIVPAANAQLVATFDLAEKINAEVAAEFGSDACDSEAQLIGRDDVDAVYIATPANTHEQQVRACAAAGKHVLCEKPLGMTVAGVEQIIAGCADAGVKLGTAFMMRCHAQHQAALKMVSEGRIGKPTYARAQLSCWYPPMAGAWRQDPQLGGGGSLIDMGGHCIDLLEMFFGKITKVSCFTNRTVHDYASEDSAVAMLMFDNGAIGTVDTMFCLPDASSRNVLELYGSKGSILATQTVGQGEIGEMTAYLEDDDAGYDAQQARDDGEGAPGTPGLRIAPEPVNMYRGEIEEFSQAIIDDREPAISAELGLRSQQILAACYESARTGQAVAV